MRRLEVGHKGFNYIEALGEVGDILPEAIEDALPGSPLLRDLDAVGGTGGDVNHMMEFGMGEGFEGLLQRLR